MEYGRMIKRHLKTNIPKVKKLDGLMLPYEVPEEVEILQ